MSEKTTIEWTDATVNFWWGCDKVSEGCRHCYAADIDRRFNKGENWRGKRLDKRKSGRELALKLNRKAKREGRRLRVFSASMGDWLDPKVPIDWFVYMLRTIWETPHLDWQLLTKRPELWAERIQWAFNHIHPDFSQYTDPWEVEEYENSDDGKFRAWLVDWFYFAKVQRPSNLKVPDNIWVGTSAENQDAANKRIPALFGIPSQIRFVSCEPLLGPVDLCRVYFPKIDGSIEAENVLIDQISDAAREKYPCLANLKSVVDWVIVGGESGPKARLMHPDWVRALRDQCQEAEVAFFMKQMGGVRKPFPAIPEDLFIREFPKTEVPE